MKINDHLYIFFDKKEYLIISEMGYSNDVKSIYLDKDDLLNIIHYLIDQKHTTLEKLLRIMSVDERFELIDTMTRNDLHLWEKVVQLVKQINE